MIPQILQPEVPSLTEVFLHDMIVKRIDGRQVMLASYWDAGYVALDVSTRPGGRSSETLISLSPILSCLSPPELQRCRRATPHQAEFNATNKYVAGDEDFDPYAVKGRNLTDDTLITGAGQGSDTPPLPEGESIQGKTVYVGRACDADEPVPAGDGTQIAVLERGVCTFTEKVANVEEAEGYVAVVIFNREGSDACTATLGISVEGGIPIFGVTPRGPRSCLRVRFRSTQRP